MSAFRSMLQTSADASVRTRLGIAFLASLGLGALTGTAPFVLNLLINAITRGADGREAFVLAGAYVGAHVLARLLEQVQAYAFATGDQRLQQRLGAAGLARLLRLPLQFHIENQAGGLMQALSLGLQGVRLWLTHLVFSVLPLAAQLGFVGFIAFGVFDAGLAWTLAGAIISYAVIFSLGARRQAEASEAISAAAIEANGYLADALANVEALKGLGAEGRAASRYGEYAGKSERSWRDLSARRARNGVAVLLVFASTLVLAMVQAIPAAIEGRLTPGGLVLLVSYLLQSLRPLEMAGMAVRDLAQGLAYLRTWARTVATPEEDYGEDVRVPESPADPPAIAFRHVSFGYTAEAPVLSDVSFDIPSGGVLAVVGASGAGKSSLIRLLLRHCRPQSGEISLGDQALGGMSVSAVRARIAVVSQETVLFNASLEANLLLANPDADEAMLAAAIALARLDALVARLPAGLSTIVGERGQRLSGGERQRVALARAILKQAPVLLLDEPTSALDNDTERAVLANLSAGASRRTILLVTHRLEAAAGADRILVLSEGRVDACGTHKALLASDGLYAEMWRRHAAAHDPGSSP